VVQDIGHDDAAQGIIGKWKVVGVQNDARAGARKDFRSDQVGNELGEKSSARPYLQCRTGLGRQRGGDRLVPLGVDLPNKRLLADYPAPQIRCSRIIDVQPPRQRVSQKMS
jgi:hypothetical protein